MQHFSLPWMLSNFSQSLVFLKLNDRASFERNNFTVKTWLRSSVISVFQLGYFKDGCNNSKWIWTLFFLVNFLVFTYLFPYIEWPLCHFSFMFGPQTLYEAYYWIKIFTHQNNTFYLLMGKTFWDSMYENEAVYIKDVAISSFQSHVVL